jgi:hypothetical protein
MSKSNITPTVLGGQLYKWKNHTTRKLQTEIKLCMYIIKLVINSAQKKLKTVLQMLS